MADEYATSSGAASSAAYRPAPNSNGNLHWLPYQAEKVKPALAVRAVQYTTALPNDAWAAQQKMPTPAVRPSPGKTLPPNALNDPPEERKPALLPAPPAELANPLAVLPSALPSEPAAGADSVIPTPTFPADRAPDAQAEPKSQGAADTPGLPPSIFKLDPNEPNGNPGNNVTSTEKELNKTRSESEPDCFKVKDLKRITELDTNIIAMHGEVPKDCPWGNEQKFARRSWQSLTFTWTASALCHKPLYFEDEHLERYGHMWGPWLQPIISHARFFALVPALPYEMGLEPPNECVYALGYYRPGSCAPYYLDPIPLSVRATLFEGAAVAGGVIILP
jgi:hypothetical protein